MCSIHAEEIDRLYSLFEVEEFKYFVKPSYRTYMRLKLKDADHLPVSKKWDQRAAVIDTSFKPFIGKIQDFEIRDDDVWIVTFPKCGTTWTQEMAWLLLNNFNYNEAKNNDMYIRSPFLEYSAIYRDSGVNSFDECAKLQSPRLIKTHLPMPLLPRQLWSKKAKIIYVARDPRDVAVSNYYHKSGVGIYDGEKNDHFQKLLDDDYNYCSYWDHVLEFWSIRNQENVLFLSYEKMKKDLRSVVTTMADFLNKVVPSEQMENLLDHLSIDKMKTNKSCNREHEVECNKKMLIHKSETLKTMAKESSHEYEDEMDSTMQKMFNEWTENALKPNHLTLEDLLY